MAMARRREDEEEGFNGEGEKWMKMNSVDDLSS